MKVLGLNQNIISFRSVEGSSKVVSNSDPINSSELQNDTFIENQEVKPKKTFKERIGDIAKFFVNLSEMSIGVVKGLFFGAVSAAAVILGNCALNLKSRPTTKGSILASAVGIGVATYHMIKARLISNQRTANVDHQLNIGHRDK